jgi:hypothetical protein
MRTVRVSEKDGEELEPAEVMRESSDISKSIFYHLMTSGFFNTHPHTSSTRRGFPH